MGDNMIIDTHAHISKTEINNLEKKMEIYTSFIVLATGYDKAGNEEVIEVIKSKNFFGVIGYDPTTSSYIDEEDLKFLENQLSNNKVVAIGEIGLDYYKDMDKDLQKSLFISQIKLAIKHNLPIVIHNREATKDIIDILKTYKDSSLRGMIHCFNGSYETANEFIKLGFILSINGIVTFKNSNLPETLSRIDINNLVLETDSPYLTPHPLRGTVNDSSNLKLIADKLAKIYNITSEEVISITTERAFSLFDLNL